jgi:hypothetical protein
VSSQPPAEQSVGIFAWILGSRRHAFIAATAIVIVLAGAGIAIGRASTSSGNSSAPVAPSASPITPITPITTPHAATQTPTSPATPPGGPLPEQLAKTLQLALSQHTVHSIAKNVSKKSGNAVFDDHDGVKIGEQHISANGGNVYIRVIGSTTYLNGDAKGLAVYGFTPKGVQALNGQWISLVAGQAGYQPVTAGVTISSTLQGDEISGVLTKEPVKTLDGEQVYGISGLGTGAGSPKGSHATLWISTQTGLPVEFDAANKDTTITETFTEWGKAIHVETPANVYGQPGLAS